MSVSTLDGLSLDAEPKEVQKARFALWNKRTLKSMGNGFLTEGTISNYSNNLSNLKSAFENISEHTANFPLRNSIFEYESLDSFKGTYDDIANDSAFTENIKPNGLHRNNLFDAIKRYLAFLKWQDKHEAEYQKFFELLKFFVNQANKNADKRLNHEKVSPDRDDRFGFNDSYHLSEGFNQVGPLRFGITFCGNGQISTVQSTFMNTDNWLNIAVSDSDKSKHLLKLQVGWHINHVPKGLDFNGFFNVSVAHLQLENTMPNCWVRAIFDFILDQHKQYIHSSQYKEEQIMGSNSEILTYANMLEHVHNIVFHGAPGTGKTYLSKGIASYMTGVSQKKLGKSSRFAFVQFHPSYDYTDFVEGLRPVTDEDSGEMIFKLYPGTFMEIANKARNEWERCSKEVKAKYDEVEGNDNIEEDVGKEILKRDFDETKKLAKKYVIVIDEINRGDISKIFGELFFSIDPDYRGESGSIDTQYKNLHDDSYADERGGLKASQMFYVPENLYIIGTMNDIDRSVDSLDFAMRRRFTFIEIDAQSKESVRMLDGDGEHTYDSNRVAKAKKVMAAMNEQIRKTEYLNESYQIGASYFLDVVDPEKDGLLPETQAYENLWNNKVGSLVKEYLRGRDDFQQIYNEIAKTFDSNAGTRVADAYSVSSESNGDKEASLQTQDKEDNDVD